MSYYSPPQGDYKTYGYQGDPGWLSGAWKVLKKVAGPIIGGMIGGPLGGVVAGTTTVPSRRAPSGPPVPPGTIGGAVSFPGGTTVSLAGVPRSGALLATDGCCPSGYHLDKKTMSKCVRNRRMNIANPRALRKAMRRVAGFEKLAKRTIQFTRRVRVKK